MRPTPFTRHGTSLGQSGLNGSEHEVHHSGPAGHNAAPVAAAAAAAPARADMFRLMEVFERLVDETVGQVLACPAKPDPTFAGFEELLAPIRSATTLEGTLLERGIEAICQCRADLFVVPLAEPLPVLAEAKAFLRRNDWSKASALRLGSEVHTREHYRPDLLVVDASQHRALILDIKRSVASHKPKVLGDLRTRMMAAALVARDWLERECDAPAVDRVEIAIIDGSTEPPDHAKAIFSIADLDRMLGIEGAGEAIGTLRRLYGGRIRDILVERCEAIVDATALAKGQPTADLTEGRNLSPSASDQCSDNFPDGDDAEEMGTVARASRRVLPIARDRRVTVGIASVGGRA